MKRFTSVVAIGALFGAAVAAWLVADLLERLAAPIRWDIADGSSPLDDGDVDSIWPAVAL